MDRPETLNLLRRAHDEITSQRRVIAELAPKAHAYDTLAIIARLSEPTGNQQGYGEDVAWRLKQAVEQLEKEREEERGQTQGPAE